ncbi:MAG TPA: hypothetical protein VEU62_18440 [Bryobacterales bacterium]|nr:hypothetical protein [Bryobacterales bacterium]
MRVFQQCAVGVAALFLPTVLMATARQPVGFAAGDSRFTVGSSVVENQSTLFDGDRIAGSYLATRIILKDGSRYLLGIDSEGVVHHDDVALSYGSVDLMNSAKPAHVIASSWEVAAEKPGSTATVYVSDKQKVTVFVRTGEVKVSRLGSARSTTLHIGQLVVLKADPKGNIQLDSDGAVLEVNRVQSEQVADLVAASKSINCLAPAAEGASRSFASLSSQVAANQAARSALQGKIDSGVATATDLRSLASLNTTMTSLSHTSASFSESLDDAVYQFHHPGGAINPFPSPHTVHGHLNQFPHHGQHGHTITGYDASLPYGHHQVPPHHYF